MPTFFLNGKDQTLEEIHKIPLKKFIYECIKQYNLSCDDRLAISGFNNHDRIINYINEKILGLNQVANAAANQNVQGTSQNVAAQVVNAAVNQNVQGASQNVSGQVTNAAANPNVQGASQNGLVILNNTAANQNVAEQVTPPSNLDEMDKAVANQNTLDSSQVENDVASKQSNGWRIGGLSKEEYEALFEQSKNVNEGAKRFRRKNDEVLEKLYREI
jgi:hypothetical protein